MSNKIIEMTEPTLHKSTLFVYNFTIARRGDACVVLAIRRDGPNNRDRRCPIRTSKSDGCSDWHITTKVPLMSRNNHAIGIAGITREFRRSGERWRPHQQFAAVIEHIDKNYSQAIQVEELASLMFLSVNQFERKFKQVFQVSPVKFLTGYRVHRACYDLLHTDHTITQIAIRNGFYDHSHFIRHFRETMGMTPNQYRRG